MSSRDTVVRSRWMVHGSCAVNVSLFQRSVVRGSLVFSWSFGNSVVYGSCGVVLNW